MSIKLYWKKIPKFIREFVFIFLLTWIAAIINVFTFRIYAPIIYSFFFFIIYPYRIRREWLWAIKISNIIDYAKGLLDFKSMVGFVLIYIYLISIPLWILAAATPFALWIAFHDVIPREVALYIGNILNIFAGLGPPLLIATGIITKILRFLLSNKKNKTDERLANIKKLYEDGSISKDEYDKQRKKIIEEI